MRDGANRHLVGIDALRGAAALLVLLNHFALFHPTRPDNLFGPGQAWPLLSPLADVGGVGVHIFFVISGFVIAMSAASLSGTRGARVFAASRALRLLPVLWISTLIGAVSLIIVGEPTSMVAVKAFHSFLLLPLAPFMDGVIWSLLVEAVFYAAIAVAIVLRPALPVRAIAFALGLASVLYWCAFVGATIANSDAILAVLDRFWFKFLLLRHGLFFAIGMLVWHGWTHGFSRVHHTVLGLLGLFALLALTLESNLDPAKSAAKIVLWGAGMGWLATSLRPAFAAGYRRPLRWFGDLSYPLYLNHLTLGMAVLWGVDRLGLHGAASFAVTFAVVVGVSVTVMRLDLLVRSRVRHSRVWQKLSENRQQSTAEPAAISLSNAPA